MGPAITPLEGTSGTASAGGKKASVKEEVWWGGKWDRKFLGKIKDFESKEEARREAKHLKAYLKGRKTYTWGYKEITDPATGFVRVVPNVLEVQQQLIKIK